MRRVVAADQQVQNAAAHILEVGGTRNQDGGAQAVQDPDNGSADNRWRLVPNA